MKILASLAAGAAAALGAYAETYASQPAGSAACTRVMGTFLAVFIAGVALAALAGRADRRREAAAARRLEQVRDQGKRALDVSRERDRRARASEQRVQSVYAATVYLNGTYSTTTRAQERQMQAVLDAARRNASRAEIAEADRRYRQMRRSYR